MRHMGAFGRSSTFIAALAAVLVWVAPAGAQVVSPQSLTFEPRDVGTRSASQSVFVRNPGPGNMTVSAPALSGAHAGDFSLINGCPQPPNVLGEPGTGGSECSIAVIFTPQAVGERTATLTIDVNRDSGPETYTVSLSGTGTAPSGGGAGGGTGGGGTGGGSTGGGSTGGGTGGGTGAPAPGTAPALGRVVVPARVRLRTARRSGLTVRFRSARTQRVFVRLWLGGRLFYARTFPDSGRVRLRASILRRALRRGRYEVWLTPIGLGGRRGPTITRRVRIVR
jgi:hypothetical protein